MSYTESIGGGPREFRRSPIRTTVNFAGLLVAMGFGVAGCQNLVGKFNEGPAKPGRSYSYTAEEVCAEERSLRDLGYYRGKIDCIPGPRLTRAVKNYQRDHALRDDGVYGPTTRLFVGQDLAKRKKL